MRAKRFAAIADAAVGTFDLSLVDAVVKNAIYGVGGHHALTTPRSEAVDR